MKKSQNQKFKLYEITSFECNRIYAFIWRKEDTSFIGNVIRKVINQKKGKEKNRDYCRIQNKFNIHNVLLKFYFFVFLLTYIINTIWRREHVRVLTP